MERWGWELSIVGVDSDGKINPEDVLNSVRPDTTLVSVMMVNNEYGHLAKQIRAKFESIAPETQRLAHLYNAALRKVS